MRTTTFKHAGRTFLLLLPLLLGALPSRAYDYNLNGLYYNLDVSTRTATLTNSGSYNSYSGAINIPETFVGPKNLTYTVTAIGDNAFRGCSSLTAVNIPVTVETIGAYAFYGCSGLPELSIPSLVEDIGSYAFYNCSSLTAMALPPFLTTIKAYTFYGCSKLTSVTIPSNLTTIENNAFYGCSKLPRVTLPQTLTTIGSQAFYGCSSLATASMSQALVSLGSEAFRGCTSLTSINLYNNLTTIGSQAFYGCSNLATVSMSQALVSLGSEAFRGCTSLAAITLYGNLTTINPSTFYGCTGLSTVTLSDGLTTIGSDAFYNTTSLQAITLPASLTSIGENAFSGSGLKALTYASGFKTALRTYATALTAVTIPTTVTAIADYAFYNCAQLSTISKLSKVQTIGVKAFYGCSSLATVSLSQSLVTLGSEAFRGCTSLTSINLYNNLTTIGAQAFYGCSSLATVSLSQALVTLGSEAFRGCTSLSAITLYGNLTTISPSTFYGCTGLSSVTLSEGLTTIGSNAFYNTTSLQSITLPASLTSIYENAFSGSGLKTLTYADGTTTAIRTYATGLTAVTIPTTVTAIADYAFYNFAQLTTVSNLSKVKTIGQKAFYGCTALKKMNIYGATTSIGTDAFANSGITTLNYVNGCKTALRTYATGLNKVNFPASLTAIADNCFYNCSSLVNVIFPESLTTIGANAFKNSGLTMLTVPTSLTTIGNGAFAGTNIQTLIYAQGCTTALRTWATAITSVSIPNTLAHFAPDVFQGCNNLENIHIADLEMWNHIFSQESGNPLPVAHRIYLNGNLLTALNADFGCEVSRYAFAQCKGLKQVNITNSIPVIEDYAFMQCPDLEAVAVGSGTERIGINAFQGCTQLSAVRLGNGLKVIGKNAFYGCSGLNSLFLGDNVQRIDEGAFRGCNKLPQAKLPATLTTLGPSAFRDCYELMEVIIPAGVTAIPDYAFYDCRKMEKLEVGEALTSIGNYAFYGCKSLKILDLPNATKTIGDYAFNNCEVIRYAYLGTGVTSIGSYAFANNTNVVGFYCRAVSVPACSTSAFSGSDPQFAELYVPDESLSAYSNKSPWSSFGTKTGLSSAPVFVSTITLSSPVLIVEEGDMSQITATVEPQDATNKRVNWASSNQEVVLVTNKGNVMANEEGVGTITCTAADDNGATAKSLVIVANNFKAVTGLTLSNTTLSLVEGKEAHLTATTAPATATYSDVTWSSSNPLVAQVSEVGLVTAIATGTATITCAAADGKGAEATCAITVTEAVDPTIGDANEDGSVSVGDLTYVLSVILGRIEQGEDISLYDVDGDGVITLEDVVGIADIILGNDHQPQVHFLEIPSTLTIGLGETTRLSRTVIPYKMNSNLTWASSNEKVVTVTADGTITALHAGTATVTLAEPGGISAECLVTVDASYGSTDGHTWVDLGLPSGTRWATANLGALSQQEYGSYFAWGETQPKDNYTWGTYQHSNGSATMLTKYCTSPNKGTRDDKMLLEPVDDAATANWGDNWCMPTEDQFAELFNAAYTTSVWTEQNGLYGRLVTSRMNGNSVFLPAAGYMNGTTLSSGGSGGYYATRNLSTSDCDYNRSLNLGSSNATLTDVYRCYGQSVRPVGSSFININPVKASMVVDETLSLQATLVTPSSTSSPSFIWTSSDNAVATVSNKGVVTAKSLGKAIIYASLDNGLRGSCTINVSDGVMTVNGVSFRMVHVAGGTFQMGSASYGPVHSVTLSDFSIGETEVTQELWYAVMGESPTYDGNKWSSSYGLGDIFPAYYVSWNDCQTFIQKLNTLTGLSFRLPTEAEWEYAARGGNLSQGFEYSGSNTVDDVAWYSENSNHKTHAVGTKTPNELGLYDMSGNVYEWCQDWYCRTYSSSSPQTDPTGPFSGTKRVQRGGALNYIANSCSVFHRMKSTPSYRSSSYGLRLALSYFEDPESGSQSEGNGDGTLVNPFNAAGANAYTSALPANQNSDKDIYIKGKIISISDNNQFEPKYGYATFYISDDGTENGEQFYVFRTLYLGNVKYTEGTLPKAGDEVIICGKVYNYGGYMPETAANLSYIYSLNGKTSSYIGDSGEVVDVVSVNGVSFKMLKVAGGTFNMGATSEQSGDYSVNEKPVHSVTVSDFFIGETEVTQALWQAVMGCNPSCFTGDSQCPVEDVDWNDCQAFIQTLNGLTGLSFRLPTEAEWEFAARGGNLSQRFIYAGSKTIGNVAWYEGNSSSKTHPVGTKAPNELGLYDMSGNVSEWCSDWYDSYSSSPQTDPTGPSSGSDRVVRGGDWEDNSRSCRVSCRHGRSPLYSYRDVGLRLAL